MNTLLLGVWVTVMTQFVMVCNGYKILVVFPVRSKSHVILGNAIVRELLKKGHEVTYMTVYPNKEHPENLTQIDLSFTLDMMSKNPVKLSGLLNGDQAIDDLGTIEGMMANITKEILMHHNVRPLLEDLHQHFDLVVLEWFYTELFSGLAALYQCPLVWISTLDVHSQILRIIDDVPNPLFVQDITNTYIAPFTFAERVHILWNQITDLRSAMSYDVVRAASYQKIFTPLLRARNLTVPSYEDVLFNGSLILTNAHASVGSAPRLPQNVKPIGGYHIEVPTEPLPQDLQKIMDESSGVIYFSLGSNAKSKEIPENLKNSLIKMFGKLNETVLWKLEDEISNLPKNVHIRSWMPQQSILAHKKMKIFITHGGLLSTIESVHFGVPIIGIPIFADQFLNIKRAVHKGYAAHVQFSWDIADKLENAIFDVLKQQRYTDSAKSLSWLYHQRPIAPADELVYWLEYAIRTRGALHLRSDALLQPWYQRFYFDLLGLLLVICMLSVFLLHWIIRFYRNTSGNYKLKTN